jgi:hypothetical protein
LFLLLVFSDHHEVPRHESTGFKTCRRINPWRVAEVRLILTEVEGQ